MALVKTGGFVFNCPLSSSSSSPWSWKSGSVGPLMSSSKPKGLHLRHCSRGFNVGAFLFDPTRDPIVKDALKEPVAFMGGMFAGLLRLDLSEDPLREWIARTAEAAGITEENFETGGDIQSEESPQQIEIE